MVDIKDELDRTGHELVELRKAKDEHLQIIEDLKVITMIVKRCQASTSLHASRTTGRLGGRDDSCYFHLVRYLTIIPRARMGY